MSEMINLNSEEFDSQAINIFNGGVAGVVDNVKVSVEKVTDEGVNLPDYRLNFIDEKGGSVGKAFYYLKEDDENFQKRLRGMGKELRSIWQRIVGTVEIPAFTSHKEMLDKMMVAFKEASEKAPDTLYRVAVAYGSTDRPQKYLRVVFFPPYFERMDTDKPEVALPRDAQMTPFKEDDRGATYGDVHSGESKSAPSASGWS